MPGSARLRDTASGLCGSFDSRNNDVYAPWLLGKLRLLVDEHGPVTLSIDLLALSMQKACSIMGLAMSALGRKRTLPKVLNWPKKRA